jgi:serine/threonine-protein kinase
MIPETIGRYQVKRSLGQGGMAVVYLAHDPISNRDVAIKVLPSELLYDATFKARFEREAQVVARLEHSAIVTVYDYGEADGQPFLVMRWMAGGSMAERIQEKVFDLNEAVRIISTIAPALDEAHAKGMVHRDLKPENILFDARGEPCLADFGIVKLSEAGATLTGAGIVGTPAYMSPEQGRGERDLDGRSDIYSLGAILYVMLTGRPPYEADTPMGLIMKHITAPVPNILSLRPDLPPGIQAILDCAMNKRKTNRYATASAMAQDLSRLLVGQPLTSNEAPPTLADTSLGPIAQPTSTAGNVFQPTPSSLRKRAIPEATPLPASPPKKKASRIGYVVLAVLFFGVIAAGLYGMSMLSTWQNNISLVPSPSNVIVEPSKTTMATLAPTATRKATTSSPAAQETQPSTPTLTPTSEAVKTTANESVTTPGPLNYPVDVAALPAASVPLTADTFLDMTKVAVGGQGAFTDMALSSDGSVLAVATSTRIYFYDTGNLSLLSDVPLQFPATEIAFSPDHRLIAAACQYDTVLWDWQQQQLLFTMTNAHLDPVERVIYSSGGQYVVSGGTHTFVWDVANGNLVYTADNISALAVDISQDGKYLALPATNQTVQIIKLADGSVFQDLRSFGVTGLHFSPDGKVLASISPEANIIRLWNIEDWHELGVLDGSSVVFSGDGKTVAVDHRKRQTVNVWRYGATGVPDVPLGNYEYDRDGSVGIYLSVDGTYLATWYTAQITDDPVGEKFTIKVTRVVDGKLTASLNTSKTWTSQVLTSPDEKSLFSLSAQSVIQKWDIATSKNTASISRSSSGTSLPLNKANNALSGSVTEITSANGVMHAKINGTSVDVSYATDNTKLRTISADLAAKTDIAFTPDGQALATISQGGTVRIWQVDDGGQICVIGGVGNVARLENVQRIFFSSDGSTLATYQQNMALNYWNASNCQLIASYTLLPYLLSADKSMFVDWSDDLTFRKVDDGSELFTYHGPFTAPSFSGDGLFFYANYWDQTIHVWGIVP